MDTYANGNRVLDAVKYYLEEQTTYRIKNPYGSGKDGYANILYREFLKDLLKTYTKNLSQEERNTRNILRNEIRKLNVKINPSFLNVLLNGGVTRWLLNQVFRNHDNIIAHKNIIGETINKVSADNNVRYLDEQIKSKDFHQNIEHALQKSVNQGLSAFHIRYADVRNPKTDFVLHFRKIPGTGAYEFYKFDAAARPSWDKPNKLGDTKWQSFEVNIPYALTASEAANLSEGRSIQKGKENQWLSITPLNQKQAWAYFDLEKSLKELPLPKLSPLQYKNIVNGLREGQSRDISISINGRPEVFKIQADPLGQKVKVINAEGMSVNLNLLQKHRIQSLNKAKEILRQSEVPVIKANFSKKIR